MIPHTNLRRLTPALVVATFTLGAVAALAQSGAPAAASSAPATDPGDFYGLWTLLPPVLTIVLAIWWRQVIPALGIGIVTAAYMLAVVNVQPDIVGPTALRGSRLAIEYYFVGAVADTDHIKVLIFSFAIGGLIGVLSVNGATAAVVRWVGRFASTPRRGQLAAWFAGMIVFFDDYANSMIVGPSMRSVFDRLRLSRAKLSYIVDSTAAPVASIALIGTWVGAEVNAINEGMKSLPTDGAAFVGSLDAYSAFLYSIPYRFYPILALFMVLLIAITGRDFGPMRKAEANGSADRLEDDAEDVGEMAHRAKPWHAIVPVGVLVGLTFGLLLWTGWTSVNDDVAAAQAALEAARSAGEAITPEMTQAAEFPTGFKLVQNVVKSGDSYFAILYGALSSLLVGVVLSLMTRTASLGRAIDGATNTMARMFPTFLVLILAWTLAATMKDLELGEVAATWLKNAQMSPIYLPTLIFIASAVVSFATGTSWGTMNILCPVTVMIAARLLADTPTEQATPIFLAAVGAVLSGSVFGDHCSPISDTTVLSALASGCTLERHVWTQMPYALVVAFVSVICGDLLCRQYNQPWWVGLGGGAAALMVIVLLFGRAQTPVATAERESDEP
ncbi:MAG: hypothetical protein KDA32_01445 [Phycisphaerales bacterium]|nr:hypothetical protein [Phycisphaerales bacterium]